MRKIALCSACVLALAIPTASYAQDNADPQDDALTQADPSKDIIKFSDEQILLNNQAVDAGNAGDYKKAEQLLMAMILGGEMNIIWGNLGGVYAKQGKCIEAKDAFERVWTSPKISEIPSEAIEQSAAQALEKLKAQCSANVIIKCSPADMKLTFDDGNEFTLLDVLSVNEESVFIQAEQSILAKKLDMAMKDNLTDREYRILVLRYGLNGNSPHTQLDTATIFGISRSYVSRIETKALKKLKKVLQKQDF